MKRRRPLGQHFLSDNTVAKEIVRLAAVAPESHVHEIGPGKGVLTYDLVRQAGRLTALEVDPRLCDLLRKKFGDRPNFHLLEADALKFDYGSLGGRFKVVSNLPYYAATHILKRLIHYAAHVEDMTVMIQREVADRLAAEPGTRDYGSLTVFTQYHCRVDRLLEVGKEAFAPPPKVASTVLRLTPWEQPPVAVERPQVFFQLVHAAFFHKRKTLKNNLLGMQKQFHLDLNRVGQAGLDLSRRAETLSLSDFAALSNLLEPRHD